MNDKRIPLAIFVAYCLFLLANYLPQNEFASVWGFLVYAVYVSQSIVVNFYGVFVFAGLAYVLKRLYEY